jgi:ketosteroid isomerase-like protein
VVIKYGALPTQPFKFLPILLMSQLTNQAIIGGLYEAVNQRDFDYLAALGAPESEWFDVPYDFTDTGESAIVRPWKGWFDIFPDSISEVRSIVSFGDHVVAQGITRATQRGVFPSPAGDLPPTGRRMEVRFCDVYRLENGKIIRADSYFDFYGILKQLAPEKA